jgi:ligand-binding sensor domain-containing protein
MNNIKRVLLVLLYLLFAPQISAQKIDFKNISTKDGLPQSDVFDAVQDNIGYIWFATQGGGIAKYDGIDFTIYNQNNGLLSNFTNALLLKKDSLFIATNKGLSILYKEKFTNFNAPKTNNIHLLNDETYLATTQGIYIFKNEYITPIKINLKIDLSNITNIAYTDSYYWIETTKELWKTRTLNNPKSVLKASKKEATTFSNRQNTLLNLYINHTSIKSTKLKKVFIDKQQNTWLLTEGNGIYKSIAHNFQHFSTIENKKIGQITATHTNKNTLWFSDNIHLFKNDSLGIRSINMQQHKFKITSITTDGNENLWIGSKNKGIYIFRKQTDSLKENPYTIERLYTQNGFPNNKIQKIHIQRDTVWVVTQNAGIIKLEYDFKNGFVKKIRRFNSNNGLKDHAITSSLLYNNTIWYSTKNGALGFVKNNSVTHYSRVLKQRIAINSLVFNNQKLYLGTLGNGIWTANYNQLNKVKPLNNSFLSSLNVYQLVFDSNSNLWVGSEKGLDRLVFKNSKITKKTHYNANDGFIGIETSLNTALKTNNNLWFGTKNGITKYIPTDNSPLKKKPSIHIENIEITYKALDSILKTYKSDVLQLNPQQNHVSFTYKTVDQSQPDRIEYRWKLNENVSKWSKINSANFPNLKSGNYIFSIQSRNAFKLTSKPKVFHFYIDKPWYENGWILTSVGVILLMVLLLIISRFIEKTKRTNNAKIEKLTLENHLISLEQKALQLQMNPHFIFNVLNGIKALGNSDNKEELNTTISQFATLLRAILNNSRAEEISLSQEIDTLKNYLELELKMSSNPFEYSIDTNTNNIDLEEILIPPMLLQPFVENCIKHGFKGKSDTGNITISFEVKEKHLYCTIIDNGNGFLQSQQSNSNHKSVALKVTKERIQNLSKHSTLDISEIKENSLIKGTKVAFKIPLKTDY